ncbi:hypothetical protein C6P41_001556 [Kluyveromyces marxianus]|nr:hypothetical protein C6P41_001556 [Kluyveromyces marxianus]KAG0679126.1 hypothetical protein C6P43_004732 [Kluyveromyces marxianus]
MVSFSKLGSLALLSGAALVSAATYHVDVDYKEYLDVYYHYRDDNSGVSVVADATGLTVTVDSGSTSESDCQVLQSGMLVYSKDGESDKTLVTWDQYEVFHLVYNGQEVTYDNVNVQSCGAVAPEDMIVSHSGSSSAGITAADITTTVTAVDSVPSKVITLDQITDAAILTQLAPCSKVVDGSTSYCPINTVYGNSVVTVTKENVVTSYTTYCPLSEVVLSAKPTTVIKTITSCKNNACTATTSAVTTEKLVQVTQGVSAAKTTNEAGEDVTSTYVSTTAAPSHSTSYTTLSGGAASPASAAPSPAAPTAAAASGTSSAVTTSGSSPASGSPASGSSPASSGTVTTTAGAAGATESGILQVGASSAAPSSAGEISVYEGEANFFSVNKYAVAALAVGAAMI